MDLATRVRAADERDTTADERDTLAVGLDQTAVNQDELAARRDQVGHQRDVRGARRDELARVRLAQAYTDPATSGTDQIKAILTTLGTKDPSVRG